MRKTLIVNIEKSDSNVVASVPNLVALAITTEAAKTTGMHVAIAQVEVGVAAKVGAIGASRIATSGNAIADQ
jgi:hypothetical protein